MLTSSHKFYRCDDDLKNKCVVFFPLTLSRITYQRALLSNKIVWDSIYITLLKQIQAEPAAVRLFYKSIVN